MILNIYKPIGWTSFDVVKKIRNLTKEKTGHGGTLDPFAEGVLIIGTGADTKSLGEISNQRKSYIATLSLGKSTDTHDINGKINCTKPIPALSENKIKLVFKSFIGEILQTPPMYSAKKINGVKLYKLARKGISVHREPVAINIFSIYFISYFNNNLKFEVKCSKGTYIRVLGYEIAKKLKTVGYLKQLIRTNVGKYKIEDSLKIENIKNKWK
tara:strand:- start:66 stop:704 length:639 start_codon:yes stop_codon:yes gene_type:complete